MENPETIEINSDCDSKVTLKNMKLYEIKLNNEEDIYSLIMETYSDNKISFKAKKKDDCCYNMFTNEFKYEELLKKLLLQKEYYDNISKIFKFYDISLMKNKINLFFDQKNKLLKLSLKKMVDYDELECNLELHETKMSKNEIIEFNNIINKKEIENMKNEIQSLKMENKELKNEIQSIKMENEKLNKEMKNKIELLETKINGGSKLDILNLVENKQPLNKLQKPPEFKFIENITEGSYGYQFQNIVVFTGLVDQVEYLGFLYFSDNNYYIYIKKIKDNIIIKKIFFHKKIENYSDFNLIKYFKLNEKEDFLLTSYKYTSFFGNNYCYITILDIQNNYNQKYIIEEYVGNGGVCDVIFFPNILKKDYLVISNNELDNYTKLYELKEKPTSKNVFGTNKNKTHFIIPWEYNNNYYIIELCEKKISINNLLKDNEYSDISVFGIVEPYSGFIYNKNNLCVCDRKNCFVTIWDLINKTQVNKISNKYLTTERKGFCIINWNDIYSIVSSSSKLCFIDLENKKTVGEYACPSCKTIYDIKKINIKELGKCLICNFGNEISLFSE